MGRAQEVSQVFVFGFCRDQPLQEEMTACLVAEEVPEEAGLVSSTL